MLPSSGVCEEGGWERGPALRVALPRGGRGGAVPPCWLGTAHPPAGSKQLVPLAGRPAATAAAHAATPSLAGSLT